jgi:hypothetical protein
VVTKYIISTTYLIDPTKFSYSRMKLGLAVLLYLGISDTHKKGNKPDFKNM